MDNRVFHPGAALVTVAFVVTWGLLIQAPGRWADWTVHLLLGLALCAGLVGAIVRLIRGQPQATDPAAGLPSSIRRWVYGESKDTGRVG
jgi:hypothetical protein